MMGQGVRGGAVLYELRDEQCPLLMTGVPYPIQIRKTSLLLTIIDFPRVLECIFIVVPIVCWVTIAFCLES